jgi:hypothetical protein
MARGTWGSGGTDIHPLQVRISFQMGTVKAQTGFKLRDTSLTPANPQACAEDVADFVNDSMRVLLHTSEAFLGVDVLDMTTGEGGATSFANLNGTQGGTLDLYLPSYVTVPISLKGELRKRYGQGRMLWPLRGEAQQDSGTLSTGGLAAIQGIVDAMAARYLGSGSSSDYTLINTHGVIAPKPATPTAPAQPEVPPSWYDVTTIRVSRLTSFLRSRHVNVGS